MNKHFKRLGTFIERKWILAIVISLLLIIPAMIGAGQIEMSSSTETLISTDSQTYKDHDRFTQNFSGSPVIVLLEGDNIEDLLLPQNIRAMDFIETETADNPVVLSVVGPALMVKLSTADGGGAGYLPNDASTLMDMIIDPETGDIRSGFSGVFPDSQHALIVLLMDDTADSVDIHDAIDEINSIVADANFVGVEPIVTGEEVLGKETTKKLGESMGTMFIVAVILMLIILVLIFRVRGFFAWRWLPLGVVLLAVIYTFGITGYLSIPISTTTMSALPVLIGLGADYAIQFHNRYDEEARRGEIATGAIINSVTHIGPAIGIAIVAAILGFAALFFSPVPMIQDFGLTLIVGVVCCYLLSLFLLSPVLYGHDRRKNVRETGETSSTIDSHVSGESSIEKALGWLAPRVIRKPAIILPIAIVLCGIGIVLDGKIGTETDIVKFLSSDLEVVQNLEKLETVTGGRSTASLFIEADDVTDPEILSWISDVEDIIMREQAGLVYSINSVTDLLMQSNGGEIPSTADEAKYILQETPVQLKGNFVTEDFTAANVVVNLPGMNSDEIKELKDGMEHYVADPPEGVNVTVTSGVILQDKIIGGLSEGRIMMTLFGLLFVFAGLFVLFRFKVVRALTATLPIALIIGWSAITMYLMGIDYNPVTATLGALVIGIGVEFTILLMTRYYEEREKGEQPFEAMVTAMRKIGRAVIASGLTVVGGFLALLIARDFPVIVDFGIVTLINMLFALLSTLLVLPPLIVWVDSRAVVRWPINIELAINREYDRTNEVSAIPVRCNDNQSIGQQND